MNQKVFAKYHNQKRKTLDRLTQKYQRELVSVIATHIKTHHVYFESQIGQPCDCEIDMHTLRRQIEGVMRRHRDDVVYVGVSDAYQEVRPDRSMGHWLNYPVNYPIEQSIVSLADKKVRDNVVSIVKKRFEKKSIEAAFQRAVDSAREQMLRILKSAFKTASEGYLEGREGAREAISKIQAFQNFFSDGVAVSKSSAERIFRTETTTYFNDSRVAYFKDNTDVDFTQIIAITDGRISKICDARNKYIIPIAKSGQKEFTPPFHPNCRSVLSPISSYLESKAEIEANLGSEFGSIETVDEENKPVKLRGHRAKPKVNLPKNWI